MTMKTETTPSAATTTTAAAMTGETNTSAKKKSVVEAKTASGNPPEQAPSKNKTGGYRMVALDLDGTLLDSQHKVSPATVDYLRYLDRKGFTIMIATGRAISTTYETIAALNFPHPLPVVCSNGAEAWLCWVGEDNRAIGGELKIEKEALFSRLVPKVIADRIIQLCQEQGYVSQFFVGEDIYADPREVQHFLFTKKYIALTGSTTTYVKDAFQQVIKEKGYPSKQLVMCRTDEQDKLMETLQKELNKTPYLVNGKPASIVRGTVGWFCEILPPNVNKGSGLRKICRQHINIPVEECIAFGDGFNDYGFLYVAGKGIAMKNAQQVVKDIADESIRYSNNEEGVLRTLRKMEKGGQLIFGSEAR